MKGIFGNKKMWLTIGAAFFGVGAFVVDALSKKNETQETAEEAARIVMEKMSSDEE